MKHVVYVIKQSPKMFTNERLFTIQAFTITRVHCICPIFHFTAFSALHFLNFSKSSWNSDRN